MIRVESRRPHEAVNEPPRNDWLEVGQFEIAESGIPSLGGVSTKSTGWVPGDDTSLLTFLPIWNATDSQHTPVVPSREGT